MLKLKSLLTEAPSDELEKVYGDSQKGGSVAIGRKKIWMDYLCPQIWIYHR